MVVTRRINSTIPIDLVERMDAYCEKSGLNRSRLITVSVKQYLDAQALLPNVTDALKTFSKLANDVDRIPQSQLGDLQAWKNKVKDLEVGK